MKILTLSVYRGSKRDFFLRLESRKQRAILTTEKVLIISFPQAKYISHVFLKPSEDLSWPFSVLGVMTEERLPS